MLFCDVFLSVDEISRHRHSAGKIGMVELYSGIELRHPHMPARGDLVKLGQMPEFGTRLQRIKRIVVGEHTEQVHGLR